MELSQPIRMMFTTLLFGTFSSLVVWFVYVGKFGQEGNKQNEDYKSNSDKATIAFQAIVASVAVYYALHHHLSHMM